jgi:hypothetical protein
MAKYSKARKCVLRRRPVKALAAALAMQGLAPVLKYKGKGVCQATRRCAMLTARAYVRRATATLQSSVLHFITPHRARLQISNNTPPLQQLIAGQLKLLFHAAN